MLSNKTQNIWVVVSVLGHSASAGVLARPSLEMRCICGVDVLNSLEEHIKHKFSPDNYISLCLSARVLSVSWKYWRPSFDLGSILKDRNSSQTAVKPNSHSTVIEEHIKIGCSPTKHKTYESLFQCSGTQRQLKFLKAITWDAVHLRSRCFYFIGEPIKTSFLQTIVQVVVSVLGYSASAGIFEGRHFILGKLWEWMNCITVIGEHVKKHMFSNKT